MYVFIVRCDSWHRIIEVYIFDGLLGNEFGIEPSPLEGIVNIPSTSHLLVYKSFCFGFLELFPWVSPNEQMYFVDKDVMAIY